MSASRDPPPSIEVDIVGVESMPSGVSPMM